MNREISQTTSGAQGKTGYAVILGNLGNTRDRFCNGYKQNPSTLEMLDRAAAISHVGGIELVGTWDVTPENAGSMKEALETTGKRCISVIPDLFSNSVYGKGSYSSADPTVRALAVDYTRRLCDVARLLDCKLVNIWPGQDGFDYLLTTDYDTYRNHFRDCIATLAMENPDLRFALEYKPKEPRCFSLCARMADTLLMCQETGQSNVGVCIDVGHSFVAGESAGEAVVLARRCGNRLFHMHFNDNHGLWDDDQIVSTVHHTAYLELFYWLDRTGYAGWLSMDQYPYREDAAAAIAESIEWVRGYQLLAQQHRETIDHIVATGDAIAMSRFLRSLFLPLAS